MLTYFLFSHRILLDTTTRIDILFPNNNAATYQVLGLQLQV